MVEAMHGKQQRFPARLPPLPIGNSDWSDEKRYADAMERELAERDHSPVTRRSSPVTAQDAPPRVLCYGVGFSGKHVALAK